MPSAPKWSSISRWVCAADLRMALRNVFRQRVRTLLTLSIIGAGVAGLILSGGFVEDALRTLRESTIHAQLGHLQVYRAGYYEEGKRSPYQYLIDRPAEVADLLAADPAVAQTMARLSFSGILNNGRSDYAIQGEGIEAEREGRLGTQVHIIEGRNLEPADRFGIVIGEGVASGAGLHVGSVVNVLLNTEEGALNNLEFNVVGVFRTFSKDYDNRTVRVALGDAQELLASRAVNAVVVELKRTEETDAVRASLAGRLDPKRYEIKVWYELDDFYTKTAELFKRQFSFMQVIILLSVLLSVVNSVNMTIFERTGEFGTLMAVGTRRSTIFRLVIIENIFVGFLGSLLGVLLGIGIAAFINALHLSMPAPPNSNSGYTAGITIDGGIVAVCFLIGLVATPLTALIPARRIARIPLVEALRAN